MPKTRKPKKTRSAPQAVATPPQAAASVVQQLPTSMPPVSHENDIVTIDVPTAVTINQRTYVGKGLKVPKAVASEIRDAVQKWEQHKRENMEGRPVVKTQGKDTFQVFREAEHWASDIGE